MLRSLATVVAAALLVACTHGETLDSSKMPEDIRGDYDIFARKCSKCHSLARPLTANITDDEQWVLYVNRMRRQQGSGISPEDQTHILRFLRYYAADLRRIQAEKHGAVPAGQTVPVLTPPPSPAGAVDGGGT
jgi:hypothetical protein